MRPRRKFSACAQSRCPQSRYAPPPVCNALLPYRVFSQDNPSTASQLPDRMWPDSARCNLCKLVYTSDPQAHRAFPRGHSSGVVRITVICPGGAARLRPPAWAGRFIAFGIWAKLAFCLFGDLAPNRGVSKNANAHDEASLFGVWRASSRDRD